MKKLIKVDIEYYISLSLILFAGLLLAYYVGYDRQLQLLIIIDTVFLYIGWGILHHHINHDLTSKIVIEYVLMGSFGLTIMMFLLRGLEL